MEVLKVKYSGERIEKITKDQLINYAAILIYKINVSTGWKMPDDSAYLNVLINEFSLYLTENCSDMTVDEVSFAIRNYGLEIKDWGKSMNLSLINEPILAYRAARKLVSELEESEKNRTEIVQNELPPAPVDWSYHWTDYVQKVKQGLDPIFAMPIYDWLIESGKLVLTKEKKIELFERAKNIYKGEVGYQVQVGGSTPQVKSILKKLLDEKIDEDLNTRIANRAKKIAVKNLALECD